MGSLCKALSLVLMFVFLISLVTFQSATVKAQSKTITVPDEYPTITAAIGNATNGDTIFIKSGTYNEKPLETNKTLSLIGEGTDSTLIILNPQSHQVKDEGWGLDGYYDGNVTIWNNSITINANEIKISGVTISSPGEGSIVGDNIQIIRSNLSIPAFSIYGSLSKITENSLTTLIVNGSYNRIEENNANALNIFGSYNTISRNTVLGAIGITGDYCKICENNAIGLRDSFGTATFGPGIIGLHGSYCEISTNNLKGIDLEASSCFVHGNNVTEDKNDGRGIIAGNGNIVAYNLFDHLAFGLELSGSNNLVCANMITHNGEGILESGKSNTIYANEIANNVWGIDTGYNGISATLYCNNFVDNRFQVSTLSSVNQIDYFDNGTVGNYWNNYNGTDTSGNGIGDVPYVVDTTRSDRFPRISPFDINEVILTTPDWTKNLPTLQTLPTMQPFSELASTSAHTATPIFMEFLLWLIPTLLIVTVLIGLLLYFKKQTNEK